MSENFLTTHLFVTFVLNKLIFQQIRIGPFVVLRKVLSDSSSEETALFSIFNTIAISIYEKSQMFKLVNKFA